MPGLLYEITAIASVGVYTPYPGKCDDQHCHQSVCGSGIMNIGRSSGCFQNVTVLVCYYIALHASDFPVAVNSLLGTREGGTGTLTVDSSDRGLWRLASSKPDFLHMSVRKFGKGIHRSPASEIVIDYLPLGVFCRKQPPLTAAYIDVNYRVKYEEKIIFGLGRQHYCRIQRSAWDALPHRRCRRFNSLRLEWQRICHYISLGFTNCFPLLYLCCRN